MAIYDAPESLHVGTGVETVFGFNWPYLLPRDLLVTLNGAPVPTVLASPNQVVVAPAPAAGTIVRIFRNTPAQNPTYLFASGIPMLPRYIDGNNKQLLYALQEGLLQFAQTQATAEAALEAARLAQVAAEEAAASAAQQAVSIRRTLRVAGTDPEINPLQSVEARAGRVLGFDQLGNPVATLPASGSGTELALQLATPTTGTYLVGYRAASGAEAQTLHDELESNPVRPEQYFKVGRSTAEAIQLAVDYAASVRRAVLFSRIYDVDVPIYLPAHSYWYGPGGIRNVRTLGPNIEKLAVLPGNYNPAEFRDLAYVPCSATVAGQRFVQVADASGFAAGDPVFVRSARYYTGFGSVELPLFGCFNEITAVVGGVLELRYPVIAAGTDMRVARANTATLDIFGRRTLYCCVGSTVRGLSLESVTGNAMERGGFLGCDFDFKYIRGLTGVFTNGVTFSSLRAGLIECDRKVVDLAGCSVGSYIRVDVVSYRFTSNSAAEVLVALNESALHNHVSIGVLSVGEFAYPSQSLVQIGAASHNTVAIQSVLCGGLAGNLVLLENVLRSGGGQSQSQTEGNTVCIDSVQAGTALQRYVYFRNDGGLNRRNTVRIHNGVGVPTQAAVSLAGSEHSVRGSFTGGAISIGSATNCDVDVRTPGIATGFVRSAGNTLRLNGVDYVTTPRITGGVVYNRGTLNGGGAGVEYTPDLANGSIHMLQFTSATTVTVRPPLNAVAGDTFTIELRNGNTTTSIVPAFDSYLGTTPVAIEAGHASTYTVRILTGTRRIRVTEVGNYAT